MIIPSPKEKRYRDEKVIEIRDACLSTQRERSQYYARRRRFFMFGTGGYEEARHNRLAAHLDLVASFLYSADNANYSLSAPLNSTKQIVIQAQALGDHWNETFRDCGVAYLFASALLWALINDTTVIKLGWNDARDRLQGKLIMPNAFGVYDESEPDFDSQEAFCHVYRLNYDEACARLWRAGLGDKIKELGVDAGSPIDDMPPVLKQLILTSQGSTNLTANIMGQAPMDVEPMVRYEAKSDIATVEFHELWIWDTLHEDYMTFTIAKPDIILSDSRETIATMQDATKQKVEYGSQTNLFLPEMTPFIPITPFPLPDYFWGEAHSERLIKLQQWTNERLDQIAEIMEMQVSPPTSFAGFMGLADEKAAAFGGPDSWVIDALPQAKVEQHRPNMPDDLFAEYTAIGQVFLEASGLTSTVTGKGEEGVRGKAHAKQLATTGSARIRKTAIGLEPCLVALGHLGLKLVMHNDDEPLLLPDGGTMLAHQFAPSEWNLRIAGHSHSPLFVDEARELADRLIGHAAIDREMYLRLLHPPQLPIMLTTLRENMQKEALAHAQGTEPPGPPTGKPNGATKGKHDGHAGP